MSGATETTADFQISPVGNSEECIKMQKRIVKILCRFHGVGLLVVDRAKGTFTISTVERPEVIRDALQQKFQDKSVTLCRNREGGNKYTEISQVIRELTRSPRLQNVEWTRDGLKINFFENPSSPHDGYVPPTPSAPYQEDYVNGLPVGYNGYSPKRKGCGQTCTIL